MRKDVLQKDSAEARRSGAIHHDAWPRKGLGANARNKVLVRPGIFLHDLRGSAAPRAHSLRDIGHKPCRFCCASAACHLTCARMSGKRISRGVAEPRRREAIHREAWSRDCARMRATRFFVPPEQYFSAAPWLRVHVLWGHRPQALPILSRRGRVRSWRRVSAERSENE